jgi:osmoprotectant transport system substrate-binding protein
MRTRLSLFVMALVLLAGCAIEIGQPPAAPPVTGGDVNEGDIIIASFDFDESELLAELYASVLEENGYPVARYMDLGAREIVQPAIQQGKVELVPEYAGSAFEFLTFNGEGGAIGSDLHTRLSSLLVARGVEVLSFAPAQDKNAVVVTAPTAAEYGLKTISDLAELAPELTLGGPPECPQRPLCLLGLERTYGLEFGNFQPLEPGAATVAALTGDEIDAGVMFSTDPQILTYNLTLLRDDRRLQPRENVVPILRREVVEQHGDEVVDLIDSVSERLTTVVLRSLNRQMASGLTPREVALGWLRTEGLVR